MKARPTWCCLWDQGTRDNTPIRETFFKLCYSREPRLDHHQKEHIPSFLEAFYICTILKRLPDLGDTRLAQENSHGGGVGKSACETERDSSRLARICWGVSKTLEQANMVEDFAKSIHAAPSANMGRGQRLLTPRQRAPVTAEQQRSLLHHLAKSNSPHSTF